MMNKLSRYSRAFYSIVDNEVVLYNSINRALVELPTWYLNGGCFDDRVPAQEMESLKEMGFIETPISLSELEMSYNNTSKLIISLETSLNCNLRCPYCYQIGSSRKKNHISDNNLKLLLDYISEVFNRSGYNTLTLKILGGEPTLEWKRSGDFLQKVFDFTRKNNIFLNLMIDTNGTRIEDFVELKEYDAVTFTIPLTYKTFHDSIRKDANGNGTYHLIVKNVNRIKQVLGNSNIVLRYNTDNDNIQYFEEYVREIRELLHFTPIISPSYTVDLGEGSFKNKLDYVEYVKWLSTTAIDILAENDCPIVITPFTFVEKCQYRSPYSIKVFSDGRVGSCAMDFFSKNNPTLSEIMKTNLKELNRYWNGAKAYSVFEDQVCMSCPSLFLCGASYKLPCTQSLSIPMCMPDGNHNVILKDFIGKYIEYSNKGKMDLFVGFNDYQIYK